MTRFVKTPLVILLLVGLLFASSWQVFAVQRARAQVGAMPDNPTPTPMPPAPNPTSSLTFAFTSDTRQGILMRYHPTNGEAFIDYNFDNSGSILSGDQKIADVVSPQVLAVINSVGANDQFWKYSSATNIDRFLLIGANVTDKIDPDHIVGKYYSLGVGKVTNGKFDWADFMTPDGFRMDGLINSSPQLGTKINWTISDQEACTQMNAKWASMVSNMKDILVKDPKDNSTYWDRNSPPGWRQAINVAIVSQSIRLGLPGVLVAGGAVSLANKWSGYDGSYALNDAGMQKAQNIRVEAIDLKAIVEQIKGKGNTWPTDRIPGCQPKKIDENLEFVNELIATPNDFLTAIDALIKAFENAVAAKTGLDPNNTCGNGLSNVFGGGGIFEWMFCKVAEVIHGVANFFMGMAFGYLESSLGVDAVHFSKPVLDTSINNTKSGVLGTGTTTGGTSTTGGTPAAAAPLNLQASLTISNATNYNQLKIAAATGVWAKVKKGSGTSDLIEVKASFSNWNDSKKTVDSTFTTTTNVPVDWTSIRIYGGKTGSTTSLFAFTTNYPASGKITANSD